jgi:hypothetical protein
MSCYVGIENIAGTLTSDLQVKDSIPPTVAMQHSGGDGDADVKLLRAVQAQTRILKKHSGNMWIVLF